MPPSPSFCARKTKMAYLMATITGDRLNHKRYAAQHVIGHLRAARTAKK